MSSVDKPVDIPETGGVFSQPWSVKKAIGLLAVFGPAAIVASVSIGAGETIVVVRRTYKAFKTEKMVCDIVVYDVDLQSEVAHSGLTARSLNDEPNVAAYVVGLPAR